MPYLLSLLGPYCCWIQEIIARAKGASGEAQSQASEDDAAERLKNLVSKRDQIVKEQEGTNGKGNIIVYFKQIRIFFWISLIFIRFACLRWIRIDFAPLIALQKYQIDRFYGFLTFLEICNIYIYIYIYQLYCPCY